MKNFELHEMLSRDEQLMVDFVKACLQIDPSTRMQAEEALRHPWFRELLIQSEIEIDHAEIEEQTTPNKGIK